MAAIPSILKGGQGLMNSTQNGMVATGASPKQLKTAYNQTQESIKQQQDFVNALGAQNGLSNQANVFNQQQGLANQLQGVADGTGPNPAQAMLNQSTGQNVANQAALMAGQRGAGANAGLIARQAAQTGGALQQQAVGQGATLQAQQSLGALGQLQGQQANMAGLANTQVGQQQSGLQNLGQQSLGQQANLYGLQQNANNVNASIAAANQGAKNNLIGNLTGAAGTALGMMYGGPAGAAAGHQIGSSLGSGGGGGAPAVSDPSWGLMAEGGVVGPKSYITHHMNKTKMANGGKVPALVSPGEIYLKPTDVAQVAQGQKSPLDGEKIPGKPKVAGAKNSYANDTVSKQLDEGGIVLPRSVTQAKNAPDKAAEFVRAVLAKSNMKK